MTARHVDLSPPSSDLTSQPLPELVTVCLRHAPTIADRIAHEGTFLAVRLLLARFREEGRILVKLADAPGVPRV